MIKVGICLFQNMRYAPFLKQYEQILSEIPDCNYKVLYLDRKPLLNEPEDDIYSKVKWINVKSGVVYKIINSFKYYKEAKQYIKKEKFDFIIVLTTMPAVLLSGFLAKKYKGKYIVDVRDYTQEHFKIYKKLEKKVFGSSAMSVISSPGYTEFLPEFDYKVFHNNNINKNETYPFEKAKNRPIVISNIGSISYAEQWKKLITLANGDERFELNIYGNDGTGGEIPELVAKCNNPKIKIMAPFKPEQKKEIYLNSDIVFNCYGNDRPLVKYALSNRLYDGAFYKKPLIVSPDTIMEKSSNGFAYALDLENITNLDGLYQWYTNLDEDKYNEFAETLLDETSLENEKTISEIKRLIKEHKK